MSALRAAVVLRRAPTAGAPFVLDAAIEAGRGITVLWGESGAGKTSLLLALLGAVRLAAGSIRLGDRTLFDADRGIDLPTRSRRIGIVFQDALLFPHRTVLGNVAFGIRGANRPAAARALLDRTGAAWLADRRVDELSGGQRQRVALARALAAAPDALLLDEPFSSVDATGRRALGGLLRELADASTMPFVLVTHDLGEALRLGDRMVVLEHGAVVQTGTPAEIVLDARAESAARARGTDNLFAATVVRDAPEDGYTVVDLGGVAVDVPTLSERAGARVALGLRAEDVLVCRERPGPTSARNALPGRVVRVERTDGTAVVHVETPVPVRALVTAEAVRELGLGPGVGVHLLIKAASFRTLG